MKNRLSEITREKLIAACTRRGGVILSYELDDQKRVALRCEFGHVWRAFPYNVIKGSWCSDPACLSERISSRRSALIRDDQVEKIRACVGAHAGQWINQNYKNNRSKIELICANGHEFSMAVGTVINGSWCPKCQGRLSDDEHLDELRQIARQRGGQMLSQKYEGVKSRIQWRCSQGHEWMSTPGSVRTLETWCPVCANVSPSDEDDVRKNLEAIAAIKGGELLSLKITRESGKKWFVGTLRCAAGHEWSARSNHLITGSWCPMCNTPGVKEKVCRQMLEWLTNCKFPKRRPRWLKNQEGAQLELDGYCEDMQLAFASTSDSFPSFMARKTHSCVGFGTTSSSRNFAPNTM